MRINRKLKNKLGRFQYTECYLFKAVDAQGIFKFIFKIIFHETLFFDDNVGYN